MVEVYRNLRKPGFFSVRENRKVVGHVEQIALVDVSFVVKENGRIRSINVQREVHAWVAGTQIDAAAVRNTGRVIRYCPFERGAFYFLDSGEEVTTSAAVVMQGCKVYLAELV